MKKFNALFIFLLIPLISGSQDITHDTMTYNQHEEAKVIATVRQLAILMVEKDIEGMREILDTNYTLTHMTGYIQPKEEWFNEVIRESMQYYSAQEVSYNVTINNDTAEVTVRNLVDARIWGNRHTWQLQQKMKLKKSGEKWIILKSVASTF